MKDILTQSWAEHLIDKYQEEYNETLSPDDDIAGILQVLMDKSGCKCGKKSFEDIVDKLIRNYL